ncbi:hypothetical protein [Microcystis phage Mae-JY35]
MKNMRATARLCGLVLTLVTTFAAVGSSYAADLQKMQTQMFGVTAQLNGNCSGTLVHSSRDAKSGEVTTYLLTAKHCIKSRDKDMAVDLPVYQKNRIVKTERYVGRVKSQHWKHDLALIEFKDRQTWFEVTAILADKDVVLLMGEPTWTVGYPQGRALTVTTGVFGSRETLDFPSDGTEYFRATPMIAGGNSGGALYREQNGEFALLGVTTARSTSEGFIAFYTPIDAIHEFLKTAAPEIVGKGAFENVPAGK